MPYEVQQGDTIAKVTSVMNTNWQTLKRMNPHAVGRLKNDGNWFLREGAVLRGPESFESRFAKSLAAPAAEFPGRETEPVKEEFGSSRASKDAKSWASYTIQPGDTLWQLAVRRFRIPVSELIEANGIDDARRIQPGQVIRVPPARQLPKEADVVASWYGRDYHGRPMANGEFYNMYANTIAHRDLPFGTRVELRNMQTGEKVTAVVKDRGPFVEGRDVDLSYGLARRLSLVENGVGTLRMKVLG